MARQRLRAPLLVLGIVSLLAALWGGLLRLGWGLPLLRPTLLVAHGPLMVCGFLGTLIGLERAVALSARRPLVTGAAGGQSNSGPREGGWAREGAHAGDVASAGGRTGLAAHWAYVAPSLTGLGAMAVVSGVAGFPGRLLISLGSLGLVAMFVVIVRRQPAPFTFLMGSGALAWFIGNGLWLIGWPISRVVPWWAGFLVLTIAGERLEMSRLLRLARWSQGAFLIASGLFGAGVLLTSVAFDVGVRLAGAGMITLGLWLLRHDIARRTVRQSGLPRFVAVCLLSGYVWLSAGGLLQLLFGGVTAGPRYDAMWHALFLGFVMAMIVGHAPIIFPALLGRPMRFRVTFYIHLALLHLSLLLRVVGDLTGWLWGRRWGGLLNVIALLLFLVNTLFSVRSAMARDRAAETNDD